MRLSEHADGDFVIDIFVGPNGEEMQVFTYRNLATTPEDWLGESAWVLERDFGEPPAAEVATVAGLPGALFTLDAESDGEAHVFHQLVLIGDGMACDINWWWPIAQGGGGRELFDLVVSSFVPLP